MKRKGFLKISILASIFAVGMIARADGGGGQFGLVYGLSVPDADNTNTFHLFGMKGEAFIVPTISFGGYFFNSDRSGQVSSSYKFIYNLTGIQAAYHFPSSGGDTFVGLRIGMTKLSQNPGGVDATFSPYHYGLASGYDYYLTDHMSVGFEGSYLHVLPGRTSIGNTQYDDPSFNIINFLLTFQMRI